MTMLKHYKKGWSSKIKSFQLQKFVAGVEVAVGAFFNGTDFIYPVFVNFEHKRMCNADIGPQTGEMGTAGFWYGTNSLFQQTLFKMHLEYRQRLFQGAFHNNPDYSLWYGWSEMQQALAEIKHMAGEMRGH